MRTSILALPLSLALAYAAPARADEHPKEHPTAAGQEHPKEHPEGQAADAKKEHPTAAGQEHPKEHPEGQAADAKKEHPKGQEHPRAHKRPWWKFWGGGEHPEGHEHPAGSKAWNKQMRQEFNQVVEDHVRRKSVGGAFNVKDEKLGKTWPLELVGVHKKRIAHLGDKSFFACADFKTVSGEKAELDLDFYATKGPEGWRIDKTVIHKVNGKPRFTYNEKNEMVPVSE